MIKSLKYNRGGKIKSRLALTLILSISFIFLQECIFEPKDEHADAFIVVTIGGIPVENISWENFDWPLEIKLTNDLRDSTFTGEVKLAKLGWIPIDNCTEPCCFLINIEGKLGPVEFIAFYDISIDGDNMQGFFANAGSTIDTPSYPFTATKE